MNIKFEDEVRIRLSSEEWTQLFEKGILESHFHAGGGFSFRLRIERAEKSFLKSSPQEIHLGLSPMDLERVKGGKKEGHSVKNVLVQVDLWERSH